MYRVSVFACSLSREAVHASGQNPTTCCRSLIPASFPAVSNSIETTHPECWCIHVRAFGFKCQSALMSENTDPSDSRQCATLTDCVEHLCERCFL